MLRKIVLGVAVMFPVAAYGSDQTVSQVASVEEFNQKFCAVSKDAQHIFIVPIAVFEGQSVKCDDGESKLRTTEPEDDPGHMLFNIDPPSGSEASFDCDGKADIDMTTVAINCLPVSQETASHPKN